MQARKFFSPLLGGLLLISGCSSSASAGKYTPGTYEGTAVGMGTLTAAVTVDENSITDVQLDLSNETENYGQAAEEELVQQILDAQSADIDGVSGATITSDAVKEAVQAALDQAEGSTSETAAAMTPGTYTATVRGSRSDITVEVTVDETSITEIQVTEANDSPYISDVAIETVPQQILDSQSLTVDGVTGATLTSSAIVSAVSEALDQAGADTSAFMKTVSTEKTASEDLTTNVLVVGGGTAGLVAALAAKTDSSFSADADSGLDVTLIETNGFGGGTLAVCGGYVASYFGTSLNEQTGVSWTPEDLADALIESFPQYADVTSRQLLVNVISTNADVLNGLMDRGFYLEADDAYVQTSGSLKVNGEAADYTSSSVRIAPDSDYRSGDEGYDINGGGGYMAQSLTQLVEDAGVDVRLETTATSLLTDEEGNVTGVTVETPHTTYTIHADKVILATGFLPLDQYAETNTQYQDVICEQNAADRGFAQNQISELGGTYADLATDGVAAIIPGYAGVLAHYGREGQLYRNMNAVWVNTDGERFMDETTDSARGTAVGAVLQAQPDSKAYIIFDSTHAGTEYYDYLAAQGIAWKADTLEELAAQIDVDSETFLATLEQYNSDAAAAGDTSEWATAKEDMVPVTEAPYYAVQVNAICTAGVNASVYTNDSLEVLDGPDGSVIGNLYACGGAGASSYLPLVSIGLGSHVDGAFLTGAYAGDQARIALTGE